MSFSAKRRAAVKTEPSDRVEGLYGGLVGEQVQGENSHGTEDMDTAMDSKKGRVPV